jgi:hypothetical protein
MMIQSADLPMASLRTKLFLYFFEASLSSLYLIMGWVITQISWPYLHEVGGKWRESLLEKFLQASRNIKLIILMFMKQLAACLSFFLINYNYSFK